MMIKRWYKYFYQVDICQSEKDGDLQAKLEAIKTAEEEDFGHSQLGQVDDRDNDVNISSYTCQLNKTGYSQCTVYSVQMYVKTCLIEY